jgi:hypothetical protein
MQTKIDIKAERITQRNTSEKTLIPLDEGLVPNLLRSRDMLVNEDLNVGEEGSEQTIITLQSLHYGFVGYQYTRTRVGLTKNAKFLPMQPRTQARTRKSITKITDECIAHEYGVFQTVERRSCS